jgi:hypothetical protein
VSKKEFGRPGHFIGSQKCRFFRHTHVDHICISTVGDYCPTTNKKEPLGMWFGDEKEGLYRYYETMVFNTQDEGKRWADVDGDSYITEEKALEGHENMVEKYISLAKIIKGKDEE